MIVVSFPQLLPDPSHLPNNPTLCPFSLFLLKDKDKKGIKPEKTKFKTNKSKIN